jgi:AcrR family transcriptional regulator
MGNKAGGKKQKMSFIEEHRRRQLIDTAIEVIANQGLAMASLAVIAEKAGVSKGVISYYFKSKDELVEEIMAALMSEMKEYIRDRVQGREPGRDRLRAYAGAFFEFTKSHAQKYKAFTQLWTTISVSEKNNPFGSASYEQCRSALGRILSEGRPRGEAASDDIKVSSAVIQGMIDGVIIQWLLDPGLVDIDACREKVLDIIDEFFGSGSIIRKKEKHRKAL